MSLLRTSLKPNNLHFNVLLRFRDKRIAPVGDIEKAFFSVTIADEDRDVPRFVWVGSLEDKNP